MSELTPEQVAQALDNEEILRLHRQLAGEKLRADDGWARYEAANRLHNATERQLEEANRSINELNKRLSDLQEAHSFALISALRTMRKSGYFIVHDKVGGFQSEAEKFKRAHTVASNLVGTLGPKEEFISAIANEIVNLANCNQNSN